MEAKLKSKRAAHKGGVTKLLTKFTELKENSGAPIYELKALQDAITKKQDLLTKLNEEILEATPDEEMETEITDSDEYMFYLDCNIRKIKEHSKSLENSEKDHTEPLTRHSLNPQATSFTPEFVSRNTNTSANDCLRSDPYTGTTRVGPEMYSNTLVSNDVYRPAMPRMNNHRLPRLDLPFFDGNVLKWQTFWDSFESSIHFNDTLTPIQKFTYLNAQLQGNAAQTIEGFSLTNSNYETAVNLLRERYGKTHKLIQAYMKALMDLPAPTNELHNLRNYGDKLESYVRGLESLGQSQEMYGSLLVPVVLDKLPFEIRKSIARETGTENLTLQTLLKSITREVEILETGYGSARQEELHTSAFLTSTNPKSKFTDKTKFDKQKPKHTCLFCTGEHYPTECTSVTDADSRMKIAKQKQVCFNCLGSHRVSSCKSNKRCKKCNGKHHTSLCKGKFVKNSDEQKTAVNVVESREETQVMYASQRKNDILLKTAVAPVLYKNQGVNSNILFDEGAQRSFITQKLAEKLHIEPTGKVSLQLSAFGDMSQNIRNLDTVGVELQTSTGERISIEVLIVPQIAVPLQNQVSHVTRNLPHLRGLTLALPVHSSDQFEIDILIGADHYWDIVLDKVIRGNGPTAVQSKLGYLLSGPLTKEKQTSSTSSVMLNIISQHKFEETEIEKFWKLESIGINSCENTDNTDYLKEYQRHNISYDNGKYTAQLPWKLDHPDLPSNLNVAKSRTENIVRRLSREPHLLHKYTDIINEQEKRGFIEKVPENAENDDAQVIHYIPHHPVKKDSTTTPIRIVYDCSCKPNKKLPSLNECLMSTPPNLNDLTHILMRFRIGKYAISTDIEKAFLHIGLHEKDRDATRFFWLANPDNLDEGLTTYRFKSILFGATCSPFILNATLLKHLDENENLLSNLLKRDLYVDNILSSVETKEEAIMYFDKSREIMSRGSFNLRSWSSNCTDVTNIAKQENVAEKSSTVKILGLLWNTGSDTIMFPRLNLTDVKEPNITKREILAQSSRIYDPLGLLSPVTVKGKLLMQDLWKDKFDWDEPLPINVQQRWTELAKDFELATLTQLPRRYFDETTDAKLQLHIFVDASQSAYGSTVYLTNGQNSSLVFAKCRVAPLKKLTLPQLELMAALIGARLAKHVRETFNIDEVTFWSDSQIVLQWIKSTKQLKRFIHNRVEEIKTLTAECEWKYCPTEDNPADLLTRGVSASQLENNKLWFNGPEWINCKSNWPEWKPTNACTLTINFELYEENSKLTTSINTINVDESHGLHRIMDINRYSAMLRLLRVTAWTLRFVRNCRLKVKDRNRDKFLTCEEIQIATKRWIYCVQSTTYEKEITDLKSESGKPATLIRQLRLYIDSDGILRCRGRIHNAPISVNSKYPYLLPSHHKFTELLILDIHGKFKHSGVLSTVTEIRQNFWIPRIRQQVKKILRKCVTCRKVTGKPYNAPDPPPLPKTRLLEAPPFTVTGVDFTGALYIKDKYGQQSKVYICLFTCASTRAVHLEVVQDLTEKTFIQAFRRFTSRKSLPSLMISDNASTYLAAAETLKRLTYSETLQNVLCSYGTTWKFIPQRAPWYGGWWERLIGLTKMCLRKVLGRSYISLDDLSTIVTEIEAVLNDRPLTYVASNIDDEEPLTPSHLLYGRRITTTPYPKQEIDENEINAEKSDICKRAKFQSFIIEQFWARWKSEYLTNLREFHTRTGDNAQKIKIGDVVQIHEDKYPRSKWTIGKVDSLITGNDGLVRAAIVKTKFGRTSRPIVKLFPLEICDNTPLDVTGSTQTRRLPIREASVNAKQNIRHWTK